MTHAEHLLMEHGLSGAGLSRILGKSAPFPSSCPFPPFVVATAFLPLVPAPPEWR